MSYSPPLRRLVLRTLSIGIVGILLIYGLFEARRLLEGPRISVDFPRDGSVVAGPLVVLRGSAENAAFFSIDGGQAFVDENGKFVYRVAPAPGYTVFTFSAKDRFGRVAQKSVHVTITNYCPAYAES